MNLENARNEIDRIDAEMIRLFEERMRMACEVAEYKKANNMPVYDSERERKVVNKLAEKIDPEFERYMRMLYSTMFSVSRSYQNKKIYPAGKLQRELQEILKQPPRAFPTKATVACQGVEGAYSQKACEKIFEFPNIVYFKNFESVFKAVDDGLCDYGVLPLENSTAGSVNQVYNLMSQYHFYIVKSVRIHVDHALMANKGTRLSDIQKVYSHEQAIAQCSQYLGKMNGVQVSPCLNTAIAAETVAKSGGHDTAAIASERCAELYNLQILERHIQNGENNHTRFICISKKLDVFPGATKTSIVLTLPHRPGALFASISKFQALGLNLSKLESRMIPGSDFEFLFYFDIDASVYSPELIQLLGELEQDSGSFQYLGSYIEMP